MSKYVAVLDATGEFSLLALLASKTMGGAIFAPPVLVSLIILFYLEFGWPFFLSFGY
jgi:hypothetical protein